MNNRISSIGHISATAVDDSSIIEIGDTVEITPVNHVIAVQRERAIFFENEFNFMDYSMFARPLVQLVVKEDIALTRINESPVIQVKNINILRVLGSSLVHLGSSQMMKAEARIKNIRHLLRERSQL
jgi:spore germination protein PE